MGLYIKDTEVELRLIGKVRFTDDDTDENKVPRSLLKKLVTEAESQVEFDMSQRYSAPFQTDAGLAFDKLPPRPTQQIIKTLCEYKSVMRVLETDFGKGTAVKGDNYADAVSKNYDKLLAQQVERRKDTFNQYQFPPLPGLRLNYMNAAADDGFAGQILVTSQGDGDNPQKQMNDPSETFWNGKLDE